MKFAHALDREDTFFSSRAGLRGVGELPLLLPNNFVALFLEHCRHAVFTHQVASSYSYEGDAFAFELILDLRGEVLVALDDKQLEQVRVLVAEVRVVE